MALPDYLKVSIPEYNIDYNNLLTQNIEKCEKNKDTTRIVSWNVRGIRTYIFKNGRINLNDDTVSWMEEDIGLGKVIKTVSPDIICLQETKLSLDKWKNVNLEGWRVFASESEGDSARSANRYSGTAILLSDNIPEPISILKSFPGLSKIEGRVTALEFEKYYLVNLYVPNSGTNEKYRNDEWNPSLNNFLNSLPKPVVLCGDFNVARNIYDLSATRKKFEELDDPRKVDALFTAKNISNFRSDERKWLDSLLKMGFKDVWRSLNPDVKWEGYTFLEDSSKRKILSEDGTWDGTSYKGGDLRRIDYFFVKDIKVKDMVVLPYDGRSSDHFPLAMDFCVN